MFDWDWVVIEHALKSPIAQNTFGPLSVVLFWISQAIKRRWLSYVVLFITAAVTIAYSYSVEGYWQILKWGVTMVLSCWNYFRFRNIPEKREQAVENLCKECTRL